MLKYIPIVLIVFLLKACHSKNETNFDRFPEGKAKEHQTIEGIKVENPELELTLFGSEPNFANPTNMDIDHKGRVWICEAYNYRNEVNNVPYRKKGDRILILEDTNGDGISDKTKVFYQGEDVNSALGIAVLGNKVIISSSPNALIFTDLNGDDVPDKKEILFKTIGGFQNDHGLHSFVFGPDGMLYFSMGNLGTGLLDKNNQPLKDIYGREINSNKTPFQDGMAIRCNLEGSKFEVLGWNFRNNYELAVDSYGRVWQSDNDDDGVQSNRLNYVLPHGNFGYKDEMTGADWRVPRTNMEDSVYLRHWHQNDPGVVPNLHLTFSGSPTGILIYEGDALPQQYTNRLFLADAGTNELNSFDIVSKSGGYLLKPKNVLDASQKDRWFRPSDICVAPDGSIFVADWYDTGVGGHFVGDLEKGRVYRIAKKGEKFSVPKYNFNDINSLILALQSPNISTRFIAFSALEKLGNRAETVLYQLFLKGKPEFQARALWLLAKLNPKYILEASNSKNENIRATAVRIASKNVIFDSSFFLKMAKDSSFEVKQAVSTSIYRKENFEIWLALTDSYISGDKWYLEALGIAADGFWDHYLSKFLKLKGGNWINDELSKDIVWRSRAKFTPKLLAEIIKKSNTQEAKKYFRAFDLQNGKEKNLALLEMLKANTEYKLLVFKHFDAELIKSNSEFTAILPSLLFEIKNEKDYLEIVSRYEVKEQKEKILSILNKSQNNEIILQAASVLAQLFGIMPIREALAKRPIEENTLIKTISSLGQVDNESITKQLILIFSNKKYSFKIREAAMLAMVGYQSDEKLWDLIKVNKVSKELIPAAKIVMSKTFHSDLKTEFENKFGKPTTNSIPFNVKFLSKKGDAVKGEELFKNYCTTCHVANGQGNDFGPGLSQIGKKLTKESIYNAIINPNQGISFGYEGYTISLKDGSSLQAIITSKTNDAFMLKIPGQSTIISYKKEQVKAVSVMKTSMMPAFSLAEKEYLDLLEYLSALK